MENETRELFERLKTTLSVAGDMAKQGLDIAGKRTGEALETAKLRWKLSELQSETQRLYSEIGRYAYEAREGEGPASERLAELFAELDQKRAEAEKLQRELQMRRGEFPCPNPACPATIQLDDAFCSKCGASLRASEETP